MDDEKKWEPKINQEQVEKLMTSFTMKLYELTKEAKAMKLPCNVRLGFTLQEMPDKPLSPLSGAAAKTVWASITDVQSQEVAEANLGKID